MLRGPEARMAKVLVPLPDRDFDVTEVAVPWKMLTERGVDVVFATENGTKPAADPLLLDGVIFGQLGAKEIPKAYYRELESYPEFVEDEVKASLASPTDFVRGPIHLFSQGTRDDDSAAFVVEDGEYVSARWPGDAFLLAKKIAARL